MDLVGLDAQDPSSNREKEGPFGHHWDGCKLAVQNYCTRITNT